MLLDPSSTLEYLRTESHNHLIGADVMWTTDDGRGRFMTAEKWLQLNTT